MPLATGWRAPIRQKALFIAIAVAFSTSGILSGQPQRPALAEPRTEPSALLRTLDGHPDLSGTYDLITITPLERPARFGGRATLTRDEVAAIEGQVKALTDQYFWIDHDARVTTIGGQGRTSIVIDPPEGRVPPAIPEAQQRNLSRLAMPTSDTAGFSGPSDAGSYDDPEQRPLAERCLLGFGQTAGPPALPNYFYNNLHQIVQTPDHLMILTEMIHDARIVRMNQPHVAPTIHKWLGDSVGRWDGDTLVVDTTNFTSKTRFRGSSEELHVIERFSRIDDKTLLYRFTVEDPHTWAQPWTGEYTWPATNDLLYEYACHEGNYVLTNVLRGARAQNNEAAGGSRKR